MFRKTPHPSFYDINYFKDSYPDLTNLLDREKKALSLLNPKIGELILDVGCGRGTLVREIAKRGCNVIGVDYSLVAVKIAKRNITGTDAQVIRASATHLPFKSLIFVGSVILEVLGHLDKNDSKLCVDEVFRVLKMREKVIVSTPLVNFPISLISRVYRWMTHSVRASLHVDEKSYYRIKNYSETFCAIYILKNILGLL